MSFRQTKVNQEGLASIAFALFMVLLLSLISLGFASLVRNDQRQTLDKTLSNQAQLAAETAINRAARYAVNNSGTTISSCDAAAQAGILDLKSVPPELSGVEISCIRLTSQPKNITADLVDTSPIVYPLKAAGLSKIKITWESEDPVDKNDHVFDKTKWLIMRQNDAPILRVTLSTNLASLESTTKTFFGVPAPDSNGAVATTAPAAIFATTTDGAFVGEWNQTIGKYEVEISGVSASNLISMYALNGKAANVTITPYDSLGNVLAFQDAQVQVDVTAKAQDVVKRLIARVPATNTNSWRPGAALSAPFICKNFVTDGINNSDPAPAADEVCPDFPVN